MRINKYLHLAAGVLPLQRNLVFIVRLLSVVSLPIIVILLSAYSAGSHVDFPASPVSGTYVSYFTPEATPSSKNLQTYTDNSLSAGKFLVASENIKDPRFAKTVILLVNYSSRGTAGIIINRPTRTTLQHVLPNVKEIQEMPDNLYFGGPVAMNQITMIFQSPSKPEASSRVFDDVYISNSLTLLKQIIRDQKSDRRFRLYTGYAGWAPGQLESEIARNDWKILDCNPDILFDKAPDEIWRRMTPPKMII